MNNRYCVIMCGGVGSRFWPFSRQDKPKQFLDFFGTGRSLLQMTVDRIKPLVPAEHIILLTNADYADIIREQLPEVRSENILLEPARRNTAPCLCWAAHHISAFDPDASIVVLPSDHLVLREDNFRKCIEAGFDFVEKENCLLTLGIKPSNPNTGYGYIQQGVAVEGTPDFYKVKSFTEKPDLQLAEFFLQSGEFFWNAGIFLWTAKEILSRFKALAPQVEDVFTAPEGVYGTTLEQQFISQRFPSSPNISIDYAILEKADNVYVQTVEFGWSDLGTWKSLYETSPKNQDGNVTQNCKVLATDCEGSIFAVNGDKIIVAGGLKNYIIAENDNALLIFPINDEQRIKQIVNDVKDRFGDNYI